MGTEELLVAVLLAVVLAFGFYYLSPVVHRWYWSRSMYFKDRYYVIGILLEVLLKRARGSLVLGKPYMRRFSDIVREEEFDKKYCPDCGTLVIEGTSEKIIRTKSGLILHENCAKRTSRLIIYYDKRVKLAKIKSLYHLNMLTDHSFPMITPNFVVNHEEGVLGFLQIFNKVKRYTDRKMTLAGIGSIKLEGSIVADFPLWVFFPKDANYLVLISPKKDFTDLSRHGISLTNYEPARVFLEQKYPWLTRNHDVRTISLKDLEFWLADCQRASAEKGWAMWLTKEIAENRQR